MIEQPNALDREFYSRGLLRFAAPTMLMMLFQGLYTIVDTIFVARLVDTYALSAINIVTPVINLLVGLATMLSAGGSALVARQLGEGRAQQARASFSLIFAATLALSLLLALAGLLCLPALLRFLGASELLLPYCRDYLGTLLLFAPANLLQVLFASFFITAGRPGLGLGLGLAAGLSNALLDYLLMGPGGLGIRGAAIATGCGYLIPALAGLLYFSGRRGPLRLCRPRWQAGVLAESCGNGASELVGQLAAALTTLVFNRTMLRLAGEEGVAAITILIYAQFLLSTLAIGYAMGVAPIFSYQLGSGAQERQRRVFVHCRRFMLVSSLAIFVLTRGLGGLLAAAFAARDTQVYALASAGLRVFAWGFLFSGFNIFTSALFTALGNGKLSALLSFLRTFGLLLTALLLLPRLWGIDGVWLAVPMAEASSFLLAWGLLLRYGARYGLRAPV